MAKRSPKTQKDYNHTWFLREWMAQSHPPLKQADMIHKLGWSRAKASDVYRGQRYTQELVDQLSVWLNLKPYELLLSPAEAHQIRSLQRAIREVARDTAISQGFDPEPEAPAQTPTRRQA